MAIVHIDGFDYYSSSDYDRKYDVIFSIGLQPTQGRRGGGAMEMFTALEKIVPAQDEYFVGVAINREGAAGILMAFENGSTTHAQLRVSAIGEVYVTQGSGTVELGPRTPVLTMRGNTYHYVECRMFISDTVGSFQVRIDEVEVLNETNQDTRNGTPTTINNIRLGALSSSLYDDYVILDNTGPAPRNTFLGDIQIDTIFPNAVGNYSEFDTIEPVGGNHFEKVNETNTDDETSYVETPTAADRDSWGLDALPVLVGGDTVLGLAINTVARKTTSGVQSHNAFLRISAADFDGSDVALTELYQNYQEIHQVNPNGGGEWTTAIIDGMEVGVEAV